MQSPECGSRREIRSPPCEQWTSWVKLPLTVWVEGRKSEVRSQKSEVRSQKSEVRSQKSEVRSQKSEVRSQKSEGQGWGHSTCVGWRSDNFPTSIGRLFVVSSKCSHPSSAHLTVGPRLHHSPRHARPKDLDLRHLPGDYSLATTLAAAVFSSFETDRRPGQQAERRIIRFVPWT